MDCVNITDLKVHQGDRIVKVKWNLATAGSFLVNIAVEALDRARLLSDVTKALSDQHVNILSASVVTHKDQTAICKFSFEMADASHLDAVLTSVRAIEGVYDVNRVFNN
jgi:GTP pyrophosphokinase